MAGVLAIQWKVSALHQPSAVRIAALQGWRDTYRASLHRAGFSEAQWGEGARGNDRIYAFYLPKVEIEVRPAPAADRACQYRRRAGKLL